MKKTFKKIAAAAMAVATLAVGSVGMSAGAAEARNATASRSFSVGSYTATATLYRDSS